MEKDTLCKPKTGVCIPIAYKKGFSQEVLLDRFCWKD